MPPGLSGQTRTLSSGVRKLDLGQPSTSGFMFSNGLNLGVEFRREVPRIAILGLGVAKAGEAPVLAVGGVDAKDLAVRRPENVVHAFGGVVLAAAPAVVGGTLPRPAAVLGPLGNLAAFVGEEREQTCAVV